MKKYFTLFVALGTTTSLATACGKKTKVDAQQEMETKTTKTTTKANTKETTNQNRQLQYNKNKYYYDVADLSRKPLIINKIAPVVKAPQVDEPLPVDEVPKNLNPIQEDGGVLKNYKEATVEDEEKEPVAEEPVAKEPVITRNLDDEIVDYFVDENDNYQKSYDENGNLVDHQITKDGKTTWTHHTYNDKNQKEKTTNSEGDIITYNYDADGKLLGTVTSKAAPTKEPDLTETAEDKAKEEQALAEIQKWLSTNPELVKPAESKEDKEYLEKATLDVKDPDKAKDEK